MKRAFFFLLLLCCMACEKKITSTYQPNPLIVQAQNFFSGVLAQKLPPNNANFRANQARVLAWDQAKVKTLSIGQVVEVPIHFKKKLYIATALAPFYLDISQLTKLVLYRDSSGFHYQVLTFIPDSNAIESGVAFTGFLLSEDWSGNSLASPERIGQPLMALGTSSKPVMDDATVITVCIEIDGYNYSPADPDDGYAWSESTCMAYSIEANSGGGDSGLSGADASVLGDGAGGAATVTVEIAPPTNPIGNIADYFKCFANVGGNDHTYTVTLAVEQPIPGTRIPWGLSGTGSSATGNPVNAGHTWLILTETTAYGSTIRNVGFYPGGLVIPQFPAQQGVLNDDEAINYNVALTITVNNAQFYNILNFVSQGSTPGYLYNLNTNNCTTFDLNALLAAGINIPTRRGTWEDGSGDDPGDLGQDIQSMTLLPNMSLTTVYNFHPNVGSCN